MDKGTKHDWPTSIQVTEVGASLSASLNDTLSTSHSHHQDSASISQNCPVHINQSNEETDFQTLGRSSKLTRFWQGNKYGGEARSWLYWSVLAVGFTLIVFFHLSHAGTDCAASMRQLRQDVDNLQTKLDFLSKQADSNTDYNDYQSTKGLNTQYDSQDDKKNGFPAENLTISHSPTKVNGRDIFSLVHGLSGISRLLQTFQSHRHPQNLLPKLLHRLKRNANNDDEIARVVAWINETVDERMANQRLYLPRVHLQGLNSSVGREVSHRGYLLWQETTAASFRYRGVTLKYLHHQSNRVKAIQINQPGVYFVFSQVIVSGNHGETFSRDCAHEMVALHYHDDNDHNPPRDGIRILTSGFITQDREGRGYSYGDPFPKDSTIQLGLFYLYRQDQVRVRIPTSETNSDCRLVNISTDTHASSLGLFRVA